MAKPTTKPAAESPLRPIDQKVLESFRSFAVGFEKDLLKVGARDVALMLGAARQAAEESLTAAERDAYHDLNADRR